MLGCWSLNPKPVTENALLAEDFDISLFALFLPYNLLIYWKAQVTVLKMSYNQQTSLFLSHFYLVSLFQEQRYHAKGLVSLFVCFGLFFLYF